MNVAGRTLSPAVLKALNHWPALSYARRPLPFDLSALPPFFDGLLGELPWWNSAWRVTGVEPAHPCEFAEGRGRGKNRFTEVTVPGTLGGDAEQALPFFARVRFEADRLLGFQAKIGDTVVGPALAEDGVPEPHPFGALLHILMKNRGVTEDRLARKTFRARSTIHQVRTGRHNPHPILVQEIAQALDIPVEDLAAIAGVAVVPAYVPTDGDR